ncbi:hypothetical protein V5P93_002178 [Actinokineospora auranticolor]|uniref:DUF4175 domain-containing protein n=1 Tax=Actinokineospora auranticolor TaxID=155976 RepID=A0A2S6GET6_9PSEU|nr:hypothetical protein [Actinokineospora auranticolor]PPK63734.1 hypothetical protein CLV40_12569 [Actinokineospora auranticolor]
MSNVSANWRRVLTWWGVLCLIAVFVWLVLGLTGSNWPFPYWVFPAGIWVVLLVVAAVTGRGGAQRS